MSDMREIGFRVLAKTICLNGRSACVRMKEKRNWEAQS